ncbi:hypothetical protein HH214_18905 [Mucilaginibacter robiniae]|uniref:Lycopene cyclase n=1 Tax=Mucilaginibacter robiniae TaxID=2728022 RepID=A0A7L5E5Y0_9SPHI|nr:lycopene cyclase family protein [Mucilaginibacter robiniae]QJD97797.1 hypothetical protein HH214_18905 [Mucilaginibacter robiniae]
MVLQKFDIVIIGAGCAGLQLLQQLSLLENWPDYKVLLIDDGAEKQQSWCFWSASGHPLQHLVTKTWHQLTFSAASFSTCQPIQPYAYHYIPGSVFFDYFNHQFIPQHSNITVMRARVNHVTKLGGGYLIKAQEMQWWGQTCYSSLAPKESPKPELWQHFKGWYIEAEQDVLDTDTAILMDYTVQLYNKVHFVYVLPFSGNKALVEATFFSERREDEETYDRLITAYLHQAFPYIKFKVTATEVGCIPMSRHSFSRYGAAGEVLIGQAAGMVKASTGYTFNRITRDSILLAKHFGEKLPYQWPATRGRFRFYDQLLLNIIIAKPYIVRDIFTRLFRHATMPQVLRFLNEQTTLAQEVGIFLHLPWRPFLKQAVKHIFNRSGTK